MARHIFHRDFTLLKAAALGGLIGVATMMGGVDADTAQLDPGAKSDGARIIPAVIENIIKPCAKEDKGVSL